MSLVCVCKKAGTHVALRSVTSFGFDLDILEMRLYELLDAVDLFVPLESTMTHRGVRKPLFLERVTPTLAFGGGSHGAVVQARDRFAPFWNRILHLVDDDEQLFHTVREDGVDLTGDPVSKGFVDYWCVRLWQKRGSSPPSSPRGQGSREPSQVVHVGQGGAGPGHAARCKRACFRRALINQRATAAAHDMILFGDNDEIPNPHLLLHLKRCEVKKDALPFRFHVRPIGNTFWQKKVWPLVPSPPLVTRCVWSG